MGFLRLILFVAALGFVSIAGAQPLSHPAENHVTVNLVAVKPLAQYTEIHLRADANLKAVCWSPTGDNSPYLLADGRRYRFREGSNITLCPERRPYSAGDIMVLRFEPMPTTTRQFSLVEGKGGENQMADPSSDKGTRYWNFLRVNVQP